MNKKNALVSIVLIALMSLSLIPIAAFGFHTPSSTDDSKFEKFGPRASQILVKVYTNYAAELAGFKAQEFDVFDEPLDPLDYAYFETNDPTHATYATALVSEFGLWEYDTNDQAFPTSSIAFRQALSHIIDKNDFITQASLVGSAIPVDSPLGSIPGWYDTSLTDLYNFQPRSYVGGLPTDSADWEAAYSLITSVLGAPIPDVVHGGLMWNWVQEAPLNAPDEWGIYPAEPDGSLLVFVRNDYTAWREFQGEYLRHLLEDIMPLELAALGHPAAHINTHVISVAKTGNAGTKDQVMRQFRYHLYSGGWSFGRDPDSGLTLYLTVAYEPLGLNYPGYINPTYDDEVNAMLTSLTVGVPTNPSDGKYHAYLAQDIFMGEAGIIPIFVLSSYKAYLSNWRGVVNQAGFGINSWWTFLNAHTVSQTGGDVIRYGWRGDLTDLNVITAQFVWDWEVLGKIYDTLIAVNPYDVAEDLPYVANSWSIGTWGPGNTVIDFAIREDIYWQDIPSHDRSAITFDGGHEIDGPFTNMPLTPIDVAFSLMYTRDCDAAWNQMLASPVDHVVLNPVWQSMWPYDATHVGPWQNNATRWQGDFVQFDSAVDGDNIVVYLNQPMAWIGLHWVGGVPLIPMHLWYAITLAQAGSLDAVSNDLIYGSSDYIFLSRQAGVNVIMVPYIQGQSYRGITLQHSYFYQAVRTPITEGDSEIVTGAGVVQFTNQLTNYASWAITVNVQFLYRVEYSTNGGATWTTVSGTTPVQTKTINPGATVTIKELNVVTIPLPPGTIVKIYDEMKWVYINVTIYGWLSAFCGDYALFEATGFTFTVYVSGTFVILTIRIVSDQFHTIPLLFSDGDANSDGTIDISDAAIIGVNWKFGTVPPGSPLADINGDGVIDISDAALIGVHWQWTSFPVLDFSL